MDNIITIIFGSGFFILLINLWLKKGVTKLEEYNGGLFFVTTDGQQYIKKFIVFLQFINKSSYSRVIKIESCKYYDLEVLHELFINGEVLKPTEMIPPNSVKRLDYLLLPYHREIIVPIPLIHDNAYLEINYSINGKAHSVTIMGTDLNATNDSIEYAGASY